MAIDTLIKKFFPGIVALGLALIAYLQAGGVVELLAGEALASDPNELVAVGLAPANTKKQPVSARKSAREVIDHNPFEFGVDLHPPEIVPDDTEQKEAEPTLSFKDPLNAAQCEGVKTHIVTESDDRQWSVAVLQGPGEDGGVLRRVGDQVGELTVEYIGYNWLKGSPAVWLSSRTALCQALLFSEEEAKGKSKKPPKPEPEKPEPAVKKKRGRAPALPKELADKIEKVSETEFNIDRAVVDNVLENSSTLMRSARIVPEKGPDGKAVGIRLFGVRPDTLLGTLGLQNGDRLESINGFEMASPEKALEAYARLRTASKLAIKVTRRGKPTTLDFNIK